MKSSVGLLAALASSVTAVGTSGRSFAVLRFFGDGALVETRADPIVQPGGASSHVHTVMGASNFGFNSTGDSLFDSQCSNALIEGDFSAYWMPKLYFHDKDKGTFEPVELFYMNVYYFFEGTNDKIQAFPKGLQMVSGNAMTRTCPTSGKQITDPADGTIQPAQITCPRGDFNPPSYPVNSDGSMAGIVDPNNKGSGVGFPFAECDGYASPLRADLHFPSCYKPSVGLTNYKENMAWPTHSGGMQDCAEGEIHVPHLFYEMYWNTPKFIDRWTPNQGYQPFVFSNGDATGCSLHGDFLAAWDENTLQHIIDTCDAGDSGMDNCPGVTVRDKKKECHIAPLVSEAVTGVLSKLPGDNPLAGWSYGASTGGGSSSGGSSGSSSSAAAPAQSSSPGGVKADPPTTSKAAPVSTPPAETEPESSTEAPAPPATTSVEEPEPTPTPTKAPVESPKPTSAPAAVNNAGGNGVRVSTVWDTVYTTVTKTVYEDDDAEATQAPSAANASLPDVAGWKYAGCFKDTRTRVIQGERLPNLGAMSNEKCVTYCQSKGFSVAGTEYGGQCFCGNELVGSEQQSESLCDAACEGDSSDTCGGDWSLTLYSATGSAPLAKRHEHAYNHFLNHRRSAHRRR